MSNYDDLFVFPEKQASREKIVEVFKNYNILLEQDIIDFLVQYNGCKFIEFGKQWLLIDDGQYIRFDNITIFVR